MKSKQIIFVLITKCNTSQQGFLPKVIGLVRVRVGLGDGGGQGKTSIDMKRQERTRQHKVRLDKTRKEKTRQDKSQQGKTRQVLVRCMRATITITK